MKLFSRLILVILSITFLNFSFKREKTCQISGTVINSETKSILLVKPGQDWRFDSIVEIPVIDGKFHFETKLENAEAVNLFLGEVREQGGGQYMTLFLENEEIVLTIHPEGDFDKNTAQGGQLNAEYSSYKQAVDLKFLDRMKPLNDSANALFKNNQFHSDQMKEILAELEKSTSQDENIIHYRKMDELREKGLDMTAEAKVLNDKRNEIFKELKAYQQKYIEQNPTLVSYSFLLQDLFFDKKNIDVNLARSNYEKLSQHNPDHPYNALALNLINAIDNIKIGKEYTDFSAPDLNGNIVKLSDQINGKVALLDLWATWCGPCIAKSRTMIPVYNEYKDRGFTIIGVAGEINNTNSLIKFLEREKWPWLNLVELDKQNNIWKKYGADNSGGAIFLIDQEGKILAKDPTAEEVRKELESLLN